MNPRTTLLLLAAVSVVGVQSLHAHAANVLKIGYAYAMPESGVMEYKDEAAVKALLSSGASPRDEVLFQAPGAMLRVLVEESDVDMATVLAKGRHLNGAAVMGVHPLHAPAKELGLVFTMLERGSMEYMDVAKAKALLSTDAIPTDVDFLPVHGDKFRVWAEGAGVDTAAGFAKTRHDKKTAGFIWFDSPCCKCLCCCLLGCPRPLPLVYGVTHSSVGESGQLFPYYPFDGVKVVEHDVKELYENWTELYEEVLKRLREDHDQPQPDKLDVLKRLRDSNHYSGLPYALEKLDVSEIIDRRDLSLYYEPSLMSDGLVWRSTQ